MKRLAAVLAILCGACAAPPGHPRRASSFSGIAALDFTRRAVSFGPRPAGSEAIGKLRAYIQAELKPLRCVVRDDAWRASTPLGEIPMTNVIARFPGTSGRIVAITGHYDTKSMPGTYFVGANDGGSSTGFLLEMARVVDRMQHKNDIYLVWFDGEEAIAAWSDTDGTYGSRHLASKWATDGTLTKIKALINVDMIGDRDLDILPDANSTESLRKLVWESAAQLGLGRYFPSDLGSTLDDHIPFVQAGVSAVDLIDFDYGPQNSWWHTDKDTMDKLSAASLQTVGDVVLESIRQLEP
jgi:glutaminyl-peptide cyclotransferase